MRLRLHALSSLVVVALWPRLAPAQPAVPSTTVSFAKGASSAVLKGRLQGPRSDTHDYVLRAGAGQQMTVEMQSSSTSAYFNVLAPGRDEALYRGEVTGDARWSGALPGAGDYRVRVFLNRAAARQGRSASYTLRIAIAPASGARKTP